MKEIKKEWGERRLIIDIGIGIATAFSIYLFINDINIFPFFIIILFAYILYNLIEKNNLSRKYVNISNNFNDITFDQIGGQDTAKKELIEALNFIKNYEYAKKMGIRPLRGILLTGSPGNGKTLMAKAATSYIDSVFVSASGSEFIEMYAGVGAQRIRQLFDNVKLMAKKLGKKHGVIFIDEIEVIAGIRGRHSSHLEYDQTLNQLLVEMDGISHDNNINILVIAATNRPDILDPAILRPGRFDRIVKVDAPDKEGRLEIIKLHTIGKPLDDNVNLEQVAKETFGFSGAHLENLCNEAAILAMREKKKKISQKHFMEAIDKVILGEKLNRKPAKDELERIAYHESGHAVVSECLNPNSVSTVTITSRGQALGYVRQNPKDDIYLYTKEYMESQIAIAIAGAVSEKMILGQSSTGAASDFEQAVDVAKKMIYAGMTELGVVDKDSLPLDKLHKTISDLIDDQEKVVMRLLKDKQDILHKIAKILVENEKIDGEFLRRLLNRESVA